MLYGSSDRQDDMVLSSPNVVGPRKKRGRQIGGEENVGVNDEMSDVANGKECYVF